MRKHWSWWKFFASVIFVLFATIICIGWMLLHRAGVRVMEWDQRFSSTAHKSAFSLVPELASGFLHGQKQELRSQTWLLLGTDEVEGSGRTNILTDTILVASYDPSVGVVRLLSLPRDLYYAPWQTKVNGLYWQAIQAGAARPQDIAGQKISDLLGVEFDGVVVIRLSDMEQLINMVGGVEIDVPNTFSDELYPRAGVDVTKERDPKKLYETLEFVQGRQKMDGERAVKYMRSRHSTQAGEGGDEARVRRQQQVIESLAGQVVTPDLVLRPTLVGSLYRWYSDRFESEVSLYRLGTFIGLLEQTRQAPKLEKITLPATDLPRPVDKTTLLIHPSEQKYKQWVYELSDPTGKQLQEYLAEQKLRP
jgi:LCP family protein required for cell wall assembly